MIYKLTCEKDQTYLDTQWGEGVTHTVDGQGKLCTAHWIHAYRDPVLAVMMNPIHGNYDGDAHLWQCEGEVGLDDGTKLGCTSLTTLARVELPVVTTEQRVRFGILCARAVCRNATFTAWSDAWLSGQDRSARAAEAAAEAARAADAARAAEEIVITVDLVAIAHEAVG